MRFSYLTYKKDPVSNEQGKYIGVLVQDGKQIFFTYNHDLSGLKKYDPSVDEFLVSSLGTTIESVIKQKTVHVSTNHGIGNTTPGDIQFLEDLQRSYQGKVQFSVIREANFPTPEEALRELSKLTV